MKKKGLSLVEVLVAFSIMGILITLIVNIVLLGSKQYKKILMRQRLISQTMLLRNILEESLLSLYESDMNTGPVYFEGSSLHLTFQTLRESTKGFLKRKISLSFLEFSHNIRLLIQKVDGEENIVIKKEIKNMNKMNLLYFDGIKKSWVKEWKKKSTCPDALCLKIEHSVFKDPIFFLIDIFSGKTI